MCGAGVRLPESNRVLLVSNCAPLLALKGELDVTDAGRARTTPPAGNVGRGLETPCEMRVTPWLYQRQIPRPRPWVPVMRL